MTSIASHHPIRVFTDAHATAAAGDMPALPESLADCPASLRANLRAYLAGYEAGALAALAIAEKPIEPPPPVLDADSLGELLGVSGATVRRLRANGKLPPTLDVDAGGAKWSRNEILDWIDAGAPDLDRWRAINALENPKPRRQRRRPTPQE